MQVEKDNTIKQLLIMGNGFDLLCGLDTRYRDYFNYRFGITLKQKLNPEECAENQFKIKLRRILFDYLKDRVIPPKPTARLYKNIGDVYSSSLSIKRQKLDVVKITQEFLEKYFGRLENEINKIEVIGIQKGYIFKLNAIKSIPFCKWDAVFLLTSCFLMEDSLVQWNDVETIIFKVVSTVLTDSKKGYFKDCKFDKNINAEYYFREGIKNCFLEKNKKSDELAIDILNQLQLFESNFAKYVKANIKKKNNKYYDNVCKVLIHLMSRITNKQSKIDFDILNFNYSLSIAQFIDDCIPIFKKYLDLKQETLGLKSWSNIHGIAFYDDKDIVKKLKSKFMMKSSIRNLPAPIFGIDNHDILTTDQDGNFNFDDPRSIFTKSFRLMDNHVNSIRNNTFQDKVNVITFIGHSLNQADYSYFEAIFDQYDIFHSNVKLEFYYFTGDFTLNESEAKRKARSKREERKTMKNIVKLLTSYGSTLKNEHGENIVNKLMLEQRLSVIPNPKVK